MKRGFTLVEMLVVIGIIAVLMGAMTVSVIKANTRAKVSRATQEVKEITNAILAFEQYAKNHSLENYAKGGWTDCSESEMKFILGGETGDNNETVPVLYNAAISGNYIRDPWGNPYRYRIDKTATVDSDDATDSGSIEFVSSATLPNFFRLSDSERRPQ